MAKPEDIDRFFAMLEDHDVDFAGSNDHADVPVLTYRWCRNELVADCPVPTLIEAGEKSMQEMGLKRVVSQENHLRGDSETGQRVKMTVLRSDKRSMYLLMTAGLPGTREKAKEINAGLAKRIERLARDWKKNNQPES